jgi:hypothetical protein
MDRVNKWNTLSIRVSIVCIYSVRRVFIVRLESIAPSAGHPDEPAIRSDIASAAGN